MSSLIVKVVKVYDVNKHPNADKLDIITVDGKNGWNCIVALNQYKIGDLVVFVPPDCVIPQNLIEKYNLEYLKKNGRTGTIRLRGYISQGLILEVPEGCKEGDDVAGILGITKYEVAEPEFYPNKSGHAVTKKKNNPYFDKYTDIENIKNFSGIFDENDIVVITEKVHGSNARFGYLPIQINKTDNIILKIKKFIRKIFGQTHEFVYGSHNVQIMNSSQQNFYGDDIWGKIAKKYNLGSRIPKDTVIYGEIFGKGIQDLTYGLDDIDFRVFDIKQNGKYLGYKDAKDICNDLGLEYVPVLYVGRYNDALINQYTDGQSIIAPSQIREGIVIKCFYEKNDARIGRKILKSVSINYLLRKNGTEYK